jgi:hypothetical protein
MSLLLKIIHLIFETDVVDLQAKTYSYGDLNPTEVSSHTSLLTLPSSSPQELNQFLHSVPSHNWAMGISKPHYILQESSFDNF